MRWLKGLIFIVIALVSLGVVLFWPHQSYSVIEKPPDNALVADSPIQTITPRGLPTAWLEEINIQNVRRATISKDLLESEKKEIDSTKLLINLICWTVFLFIVEVALRGVSKRVNK